jgi:hypothetical protein
VTNQFKRLDSEALELVCVRLLSVLEDVAPNDGKHQIMILMSLIATLADNEGYSITLLLDVIKKAQQNKNKEYLQ